MNSVSLPRLYALRALYLLVVIGLGQMMFPQLVHIGRSGYEAGIVVSMLLAFWLMCLLGLRYPLRMIPVLLWELAWKAAWLTLVALPKWRAGQVDPSTQSNVYACALVVLVPIVLPWGYVVRHYLQQPGAPWTRAASSVACVTGDAS